MSKTSRLLAHLKSGKTITGLQAIKKFSLYRLASVIFRHKKRLGIVSELVTKNGVTFAKYFIPKS